MTTIIKLLGIAVPLALVAAAHTSVHAQMASCQTSGAPVDLEMPRAKDADFTDLPHKVQKGMTEHREILGVGPAPDDHAAWPDCYGNLETSWACQGDGWWCTCWKMGGEWECGCETGSC